ncbi:PepSY domain-containing protein [Sporosarcina sp. FA9]|uniref:PepSY domain-containing protein n=1 Tax=Sporosarcina sp. FA9 TaxID=3413030 RepID=UPI003F65D126
MAQSLAKPTISKNYIRTSNGHVIKAELDYDDGIMLYEIDIRTREGQKYEVKVDANTGAILKVKVD